MNNPPLPSDDDKPLEAAQVTAAADPEVDEDAPLAAATRPARAPLDATSQAIVGSAAAAAALALLAAIVGAWSFTFTGIILVLAGLAGVFAGLVRGGRAVNPLPVATRDIGLAAGTIVAVVGVLFTIEILFDLDDLDTYGGFIGAALTILVAAAGVVLYGAVTRDWSGGPAGPWLPAIRAGGRPTMLVVAGAALVVIGWAGNVSVGFWYMSPGTVPVTVILLAALTMRAAADKETPLDLGFPAGWLALALSGWAAIIALQHTTSLLDEGAGLEDWLFQFLYVAGVAVAVIGSLLASAEGIVGTKPAATG